MQILKHFIIDFDSTFSKVEALDILGEISLQGKPDIEERLKKIKEVTDLGMEGKVSLRESLLDRIEILEANQDHLEELISRLKKMVSSSFLRNKEFVKEYASQIYILSNGFKDFITPVVEEYGIKPENVFANQFTYGENGDIVGLDENNLLSKNNGKPNQIKSLNLSGEVHVLGDGFTDYEIKKAGLAKRFYAFTENIERQNVLENADHIAPNFDEVLYSNNMSRALSYPKSRINVLLLENIHDHGIEKLKTEGYNVEVHPGGMDEDQLADKIKNVSIIGIRSKTQITKKVLENADRLLAVGAFCIGTNQIDLTECTKKGIMVFNAPYSNTRSVVELVLANIILLKRNLIDKIAGMHQGKWLKSASGSYEIRGKTLGIIGYGNIGAQLSVLAETLGMRVIYFDVEEKLALGNAEKCSSLKQLLQQSDFVTLHVDGRGSNDNLIGAKEFELMKDGVIFINLSRGKVVDLEALSLNIKSGKVVGSAVDVFPYEPISNEEEFTSELRGLPNTILTPHIGGSTQEAQKNIADFVPSRIMDYINTGSTSGSVNFPNIVLPTLEKAHRFIHIHKNEPGILAEINNILAAHKLNIMGQYLKTDDKVGYVITDVDKDYDEKVIKKLKQIDASIRFRVLY